MASRIQGRTVICAGQLRNVNEWNEIVVAKDSPKYDDSGVGFYQVE